MPATARQQYTVICFPFSLRIESWDDSYDERDFGQRKTF